MALEMEIDAEGNKVKVGNAWNSGWHMTLVGILILIRQPISVDLWGM